MRAWLRSYVASALVAYSTYVAPGLYLTTPPKQPSQACAVMWDGVQWDGMACADALRRGVLLRGWRPPSGGTRGAWRWRAAVAA